MNRKVLLSSSLVSVLLLSAMFGILSVRVVAADAREKIAAAIILAYKGAAVYSSGASLEEHLRYRPNNLIQWHLISFLKQKGHKWYEVGGAQPFSHDSKLKGIYMFKKGGEAPLYADT